MTRLISVILAKVSSRDRILYLMHGEKLWYQSFHSLESLTVYFVRKLYLLT